MSERTADMQHPAASGPGATLGDLPDRVRPLVTAFAAHLPGVCAAYLRADGRDFVLAGDGWSIELSEAAAALSVALQRAFAPGFDVSIEGGYRPFSATGLDGYEQVYSRP